MKITCYSVCPSSMKAITLLGSFICTTTLFPTRRPYAVGYFMNNLVVVNVLIAPEILSMQCSSSLASDYREIETCVSLLQPRACHHCALAKMES